MNAYQKATLLVSLVALPLLLLFMQGMSYRGTPVVGVVGMTATAALVYALRTTPTPKPQRSGRYER